VSITPAAYDLEEQSPDLVPTPPLMVRSLKQDLSPKWLFEQTTNSVLFSRDNSTTSAVYNILANEIHCYGLPYGGLEFTSHVLTYYATVCLWLGRKPMMPNRRVKYSWFDLTLGVVGLCVSTANDVEVQAVATKINLNCSHLWSLRLKLMPFNSVQYLQTIFILFLFSWRPLLYTQVSHLVSL